MTFEAGSRVRWIDPDGGNQKVGTILEQTDEDAYFVVFADGSEAGVYEHELKPARFHYTRTVLHNGAVTQTATMSLEGVAEEFLIDTYDQCKRSYSELVEYKNGIVHVAGNTVTVFHAEDDKLDWVISDDEGTLGYFASQAEADEALLSGEFPAGSEALHSPSR